MLTYPITADYLSHWGIWHAAREIVQNAWDMGVFDMPIWVDGEMTIANKGHIDSKSLLLGYSKKQEGSVGKYGEGLKMALFVLNREKRYPTVYISGPTGTTIWTTKYTVGRKFDIPLFSICERTTPVTTPEPQIVVNFKCSEAERDEILGNLYSPPTEFGILKGDGYNGKVFVRGMFVSKMNIDVGVNLPPNEVTLNRDRDIPSLFDVQYYVTRLMTKPYRHSELFDMVMKGSPAVSPHWHNADQILVTQFRERHPGKVPVSVTSPSIDTSTQVPVPDDMFEAVKSHFTPPPKSKVVLHLERLIQDCEGGYTPTIDDLKQILSILVS
jgi:hypothetical protein